MPDPSPDDARRLDHDRMAVALAEADRAALAGDVPVGCAVYDLATGDLLASAGNRREQDGDPTAHAEVVAVRLAAAARGTWRLDGCGLYVTLEPCPMCAGAVVNARVARVVYGCDDPKAGAVRSLYAICSDARLNHRPEVVAGVRSDECADRLRAFFRSRRGR